MDKHFNNNMKLGCYKCTKKSLEKFLAEYDGKDIGDYL